MRYSVAYSLRKTVMTSSNTRSPRFRRAVAALAEAAVPTVSSQARLQDPTTFIGQPFSESPHTRGMEGLPGEWQA